jgi:hypothetical protein
MNVLDSFLSFQIKMLLVLIRALNMTLSLGMLDCVTIDASPPYWTAWRDQLLVFEPRLLGEMDPLVWAGSQKWSHEEVVYEQLPIPYTDKTSL